MPGDAAVGGRLCVVCGERGAGVCVGREWGEGRGCMCVKERREGDSECQGSVYVCGSMWEEGHSYCKRLSHIFYFVLHVFICHNTTSNDPLNITSLPLSS